MNSMSEQKKFPTRGRMLAFFAEGSKKWFALAAVSAVAMQAVSLINPKIISFTAVKSDEEEEAEIEALAAEHKNEPVTVESFPIADEDEI